MKCLAKFPDSTSARSDTLGPYSNSASSIDGCFGLPPLNNLDNTTDPSEP